MTRAHRRSLIVGILLIVLSLVAGPAAADVVIKRDPRDTPGRLDIRRVAHGHVGDDAVTHTITTYRRFPSRLLRVRGTPRGGFALWLVDSSIAGGIEPEWVREVRIRWRNGRLRGPIFDWDLETGDVRQVGTAEVSRPGRHAVKVAVDLGHLGDLGDPRQYVWITESWFRSGGGECRRGCWDLAPNRRPIMHRLPDPPADPGPGS